MLTTQSLLFKLLYAVNVLKSCPLKLTEVGMYSNCTEHQRKITEFFLITGIKCYCQQDCSGNSAGTVIFQETVKHQGLCCISVELSIFV